VRTGSQAGLVWGALPGPPPSVLYHGAASWPPGGQWGGGKQKLEGAFPLLVTHLKLRTGKQVPPGHPSSSTTGKG